MFESKEKLKKYVFFFFFFFPKKYVKHRIIKERERKVKIIFLKKIWNNKRVRYIKQEILLVRVKDMLNKKNISAKVSLLIGIIFHEGSNPPTPNCYTKKRKYQLEKLTTIELK